MITVNKYKNREDALEKILKLDKDYTLIRHNFTKGEIIDPHRHPVDEWLIFDSGKCEITLGLEQQVVEADKYALTIYLPKNNKHGLKCLTDITYWVLRTKK